MSDANKQLTAKLVHALDDAQVTRINRHLSSIPTLDENLTLVQYLSLYVSQQLLLSSTPKLNVQQYYYTSPVSLLGHMIKSIVLIQQHNHLELGSKLSHLSNLISDFRIFIRLWGIFPLLTWAKQVLVSPPKDRILKIIAYTQVVANLLYQPLENIAYLGMHNIITISPQRQNQLWIHSSKLWACHVTLDFLRLARVYHLSERFHQEKRPTLDQSFYWSLLENIGYLPLTVHWSSEQGLLSESQVGFFGSIAGLAKVIPQWKSSSS